MLARSGKNQNLSRSGKIFDIGKVSEKSAWNSVFGFIAYRFSAQFFNTFSSEKD